MAWNTLLIGFRIPDLNVIVVMAAVVCLVGHRFKGGKRRSCVKKFWVGDGETSKESQEYQIHCHINEVEPHSATIPKNNEVDIVNPGAVSGNIAEKSSTIKTETTATTPKTMVSTNHYMQCFQREDRSFHWSQEHPGLLNSTSFQIVISTSSEVVADRSHNFLKAMINLPSITGFTSPNYNLTRPWKFVCMFIVDCFCPLYVSSHTLMYTSNIQILSNVCT